MNYHALAVLQAQEVLRAALQGTRRPGTPQPNPADIEKLVAALRGMMKAEIGLARKECELEIRAQIHAEVLAALKAVVGTHGEIPPLGALGELRPLSGIGAPRADDRRG
jgi:hypothetical protein